MLKLIKKILKKYKADCLNLFEFKFSKNTNSLKIYFNLAQFKGSKLKRT